MEMSQIRYFIAVSQTLNFTRAAELCFISQPALTKGIKKLEESIGGELLYRTKNSVELSSLGRSLLPKFKKIYQDTKQTQDEAHRLINMQYESIRIGIQNNIYLDKILPLFQNFKRINNNIRFEFFESDRQHLKNKLDSHELDVVFLSHDVSRCENIYKHKVCTESFVIAFCEKHPFVKKKIIGIKDLHHKNFCFRSHCDSSRQLTEFLLSQEVRVNIVYNSSRDDWVTSFVHAGFGVTYLPKFEAIREGLLFADIIDYSLSRVITLETNSYELGNKNIKTFVNNCLNSYHLKLDSKKGLESKQKCLVN